MKPCAKCGVACDCEHRPAIVSQEDCKRELWKLRDYLTQHASVFNIQEGQMIVDKAIGLLDAYRKNIMGL